MEELGGVVEGVFRGEGLGRLERGLGAALVGAWWALGLEFWGLRGSVWWGL